MQWGMPTLVEYTDFRQNIALCRKLGLQFVELNMNLPMLQMADLNMLAREDDLYYTIHLDENFNPADFNMLVAEAWMETLRRTIAAAKRLEAPIINMHLSRGVYFSLPDEKLHLFERYREQYLLRIVELRRTCEAEIGGADVCICIENTNGYLDFQKEALEILLKSDVFALTWDIGHSHRAQCDDASWLYRHQERLKHFHIHDAAASGDHLALGKGEVDIEGMLRLTEKSCGRCVLEVKTAAALEESAAWLEERGWL